jgi:cobalt-zinc-cadmium efflux system outer membrane protein
LSTRSQSETWSTGILMHLLFRLVFAAVLTVPVVARAQGGVSGPVVISSPLQAVAEALARSPVLRGASAVRQAVRGDALAAPLRPNPEASFLVENFGGLGGRGDYRSGRATETTLSLAQRIELGGKRTARIALAGRTGDAATLEYEAARLDLVRDVLTALADAEAAERAVTIEQDRLRQANDTLRIARGRVDAGKEPELQSRRVEVTRTNAEVAVEKARREAAISLRNLATLLGIAQVSLASRQPWFDDVGPVPQLPLPADPMERLSANPDYAKLGATIAQQRANMDVQRANGVPDITLQGGVRRFQEARETAFIAGASIPLPFNDRNQAGIARAQAELLRAEAEADRGRLALAASLVAAERRTELAWRTVQSLRGRAVPSAERAARLAAGGFAEGKFTYIEALDAQRAMSDARAQLNDALRDFHARRAETDRLRGEMPTTLQAGGIR